jgi:hypothetical protein
MVLKQISPTHSDVVLGGVKLNAIQAESSPKGGSLWTLFKR